MLYSVIQHCYFCIELRFWVSLLCSHCYTVVVIDVFLCSYVTMDFVLVTCINTLYKCSLVIQEIFKGAWTSGYQLA